jgi:hypothetical protein
VVEEVVKDVEVHKALVKEGKTPAEADAILAKLARTLKEGKVSSFLKKFVGHKNSVANAKFRKQSKKEIAEHNFKTWKAKDGTVHTIIQSKEFKDFLQENGISPAKSEDFFEHLKLMTYEDLSKESLSFFKQREIRTPLHKSSAPMSQWRYSSRKEPMYDIGEGIEGVYNTRVRELASKYFDFKWTPPHYDPNKRNQRDSEETKKEVVRTLLPLGRFTKKALKEAGLNVDSKKELAAFVKFLEEQPASEFGRTTLPRFAEKFKEV